MEHQVLQQPRAWSALPPAKLLRSWWLAATVLTAQRLSHGRTPSDAMRRSLGPPCASPRVRVSADWEQHVDKASGKFYFWNSRTEQSVWDRPGGGDGKDVAAPARANHIFVVATMQECVSSGARHNFTTGSQALRCMGRQSSGLGEQAPDKRSTLCGG
eukprot:COSAG06_NODE_5245_length_3613_cov_1.155663_3_plen_158_part_00